MNKDPGFDVVGTASGTFPRPPALHRPEPGPATAPKLAGKRSRVFPAG